MAFGCEKTSFKDALLLNTKWVLSSIQDTKTYTVTNVPNNIPQEFIIFSDASNKLIVKGTCGGYSGTYSYSNDSIITSGEYVFTGGFCKYYQWEDTLLNNLSGIIKFKIVGNYLTIYSAGTYNLNFTAE